MLMIHAPHHVVCRDTRESKRIILLGDERFGVRSRIDLDPPGARALAADLLRAADQAAPLVSCSANATAEQAA